MPCQQNARAFWLKTTLRVVGKAPDILIVRHGRDAQLLLVAPKTIKSPQHLQPCDCNNNSSCLAVVQGQQVSACGMGGEAPRLPSPPRRPPSQCKGVSALGLLGLPSAT